MLPRVELEPHLPAGEECIVAAYRSTMAISISDLQGMFFSDGYMSATRWRSTNERRVLPDEVWRESLAVLS